MQEIKLVLSVEQVNLILACLAKAPYESVADTINAVRSQGIAQVQEASTEPAEKVEAELVE
jgi:hypothetical protein